MSQRNKPVLPHVIPCLDAGGGMILRAIGSWVEGSSPLSGRCSPPLRLTRFVSAENALESNNPHGKVGQYKPLELALAAHPSGLTTLF